MGLSCFTVEQSGAVTLSLNAFHMELCFFLLDTSDKLPCAEFTASDLQRNGRKIFSVLACSEGATMNCYYWIIYYLRICYTYRKVPQTSHVSNHMIHMAFRHFYFFLHVLVCSACVFHFYIFFSHMTNFFIFFSYIIIQFHIFLNQKFCLILDKFYIIHKWYIFFYY